MFMAGVDTAGRHEYGLRFSDLLFDLTRVLREERASNLPF